MKQAIILYNLGGPDSLDAVEPFLFNLFNDKAIIAAPQPVRFAIAAMIARRRAPVARKIYAQMGGSSPIFPQTRAQAEALSAQLSSGPGTRIFIAMRYWTPDVAETARAVKDFAPDKILLVPLYPQFSTTTTGSFALEWERVSRKIGLNVPVHALCCYPLARGFIAAHAALLRDALKDAGGPRGQRVLFSAHGLPKRIVEKGDPYQWQIEQSAAAIVAALAVPELDWRISYQSRVGPLEWIGPATDREIIQAGADGRGLVIVPIAFVSEHSETLVELDIEYRHLAEGGGVPSYRRVPALAIQQDYIQALAELIARLSQTGASVISQDGDRLCPSTFKSCPHP